jgi:hypothetical protein
MGTDSHQLTWQAPISQRRSFSILSLRLHIRNFRFVALELEYQLCALCIPPKRGLSTATSSGSASMSRRKECTLTFLLSSPVSVKGVHFSLSRCFRSRFASIARSHLALLDLCYARSQSTRFPCSQLASLNLCFARS